MSQTNREIDDNSIVCNTCRRRKIRCDRSRPSCAFCRKNGFSCEYSRSDKMPGLRAGYVAQLERRVDELEDDFSTFKTTVNRHMAATAVPQQHYQLETGGLGVGQPAQSFPGSQALPRGSQRLSQEAYTAYCNIWFERYHPWFPILHQPSIVACCERQSTQPGTSASLVLDAIAVVIMTAEGGSGSMVDHDERIRSLSDEITLAAIHRVSFHTLQAILILTIAEYGSGRQFSFYNMISLCKRISTQLGLRDLVTYNCINYGFPSALPPRMLQIPATAVEREEKIRAFWAIAALDSASTLGVAWHLSVSAPEPSANLPIDEEIWHFSESVIAMYQFGSSEAPSSFSLYVRLVTNELWHVHNFLQQSCDPFSIQPFSQRREECDAVYDRLTAWQSDFEQLLTVHTPVYADLLTHADTPTQQPNSVLIQCTIHSAIISLYQRLVFPVVIAEGEPSQWDSAAQRCLSSCDQMADVIRAASDETLGMINPHVIYCVFIAARFYIIYSKAINSPVPNRLYLFIYALRVCGQQWPLAHMLHTVLEAAAAEYAGTAVAHPTLPSEFFDLQYFSLDIHKALHDWAESRKRGAM